MKIFVVPSLLMSIFILASGFLPVQSYAEVQVNVGIFAPPPPVVISGPPAVMVIPGATYVYFVPDIQPDIFFYGGYWYRSHAGRWFRAGSYSGPWNYMDHGKVPPALVRLPQDYRHIPSGHQKIPYGQLKKNWKYWERDRHWDQDQEGPGNHGVRRERGEGGGRQQSGPGRHSKGHGGWKG
jgi:hypothetical protein